MFKAHIDTDSRSEFGQRFSFVRHGETNVPATGAAADRDGLDLADELPMPLDLEFADALDIQLAVITATYLSGSLVLEGEEERKVSA